MHIEIDGCVQNLYYIKRNKKEYKTGETDCKTKKQALTHAKGEKKCKRYW